MTNGGAGGGGGEGGAGGEANGGSLELGSPSLKYLLGGAGLVQVALTVVGVNNGGISAVVINHRAFIVAGLAAVLVAVFLGALALMIPSKAVTDILVVVGTVLLFIGIGITGYTALVAPDVAKAPDIDTTLTQAAGGQLTLTAHVKASGIKESEQYWVNVEARSEKAGRYVVVGSPIYQAQLGADGQGNVDTDLTIPLPKGKYSAVSVEGWDGFHAGPCASLETPGGAKLTASHSAEVLEEGRTGCVVLRLPDPLASKPAKATQHKRSGSAPRKHAAKRR